jgi:hypothetical protein
MNNNEDNATSGDIIGFQAKPAANASGTATVYGAQILPRVNAGFAAATLVGLQVGPILKGSGGGNLSGDLRSIEAEVTDDNAGTRTIAGDVVVGVRMFHQVAGTHTISGDVVGFKFDAAGGGQAWDAAMKFPDGAAGLSGTAAAINSALPANTSFIRVKIGATFGKIPVYQD